MYKSLLLVELFINLNNLRTACLLMHNFPNVQKVALKMFELILKGDAVVFGIALQ